MNIYQNGKKFKNVYKCNTVLGMLVMILFVVVMVFTMYKNASKMGEIKTLSMYKNKTADKVFVNLMDESAFPIFF